MSAGFPEDALTRDAFLGGRLEAWQPRRGFRASADAVLLAAAVPARPGEAVLEPGCGAGVAALCLAARVPGLTLTGLELQPAYAALARRNAAAAGAALDVIEGNVAAPPAALKGRGFDHVMANPPYFPVGAGTAAADAGREAALREAVPLGAWADLAARRLKPGGTLTMIQLAERLPDMLAALDARMGSVEVKPLAPRAGRAAGRVILRARKGGRAPFRLHAPLVLHAGPAHRGDGDDATPEAARILRAGGALEF